MSTKKFVLCFICITIGLSIIFIKDPVLGIGLMFFWAGTRLEQNLM
jgi:hypothetical protein